MQGEQHCWLKSKPYIVAIRSLSANPEKRDRKMDKVKIEEVQSTTKKQRIATHTHIKGLGLEVSLSFYVYIFVLNILINPWKDTVLVAYFKLSQRFFL